MRSRTGWLLVGVICLSLVGAGFVMLFRYKRTAGDAPSEWPAKSSLAHSHARPTLLLFVHPRCECSRASMVELDRLLGRVRSRIQPAVVFVRPKGAPTNFGEGGLRELAGGL